MIHFAVETFAQWWKDVERKTIQKHWEELALDKVIPWELNLDSYEKLEMAGLLHVVTARVEGRIVGYHIAVLGPHLHYKSAGLMAFEDVYFILPEFRVGGTGTQLFIFTEESLRERGITKWFLACKVGKDHSKLFKALGFRLSDYCFTKLLVSKEGA
ncbi:MAG: GNAT family N-acetyltransferase [Candidatus Acidiferrales bacterium]